VSIVHEQGTASIAIEQEKDCVSIKWVFQIIGIPSVIIISSYRTCKYATKLESLKIEFCSCFYMIQSHAKIIIRLIGRQHHSKMISTCSHCWKGARLHRLILSSQSCFFHSSSMKQGADMNWWGSLERLLQLYAYSKFLEKKLWNNASRVVHQGGKQLTIMSHRVATWFKYLMFVHWT
jgi:hypothetical protein